MDWSTKDQQSSLELGNGGKKSILRYPLRSSATKLKDQGSKSKSPDTANRSDSKRGRPPSSVSKSVSVLELSGKDKSGKPPRRLSIPTKSAVSPRQKTASTITPISATKVRRSVIGLERCDTPRSDVSTSSTRRKFNVLSSASYWLQQIKLSESAAKHSISLGFFKLALEARCEPLHLLRDELKSYARKHNLAEHEETVKGLFDGYEISEGFEQMQVSETCSHVPEEAATPSDEGVQSTSSTAGSRKLKPKSLNTDAQAPATKLSSRKENAPKISTASKTRASVNRNPVNTRSVTATGNDMKKKVQNTGKQELDNGMGMITNQDEKSVVEKVTIQPQEIEETLEGNKENLDTPLVAEISVAEEM